jgi:hypothetical protein
LASLRKLTVHLATETEAANGGSRAAIQHTWRWSVGVANAVLRQVRGQIGERMI